MRIIREIEARRVARAPTDIDPERTDFPIGGNRPHQEENRDQPSEEQQESEPPAPATVRLVARARRAADWRRGCDGFRSGRRGSCGCDRFRSHRQVSCGYDGFDSHGRGSCGDDGFHRHRRRSGDGVLSGRLCLGALGFDRRSRLGRGRTTHQLLQLCPGAADWRCGCDGLRSHRRRSRAAVLHRRVRQAGKSLVELCLVGRILWLGSTPR